MFPSVSTVPSRLPTAHHRVAATAVFAILFAASFVFAAPSHAQCNPAIYQKAQRIQKQNAQQAAKHAVEVFRATQDQPSWVSKSDGLLTACAANNWPKINLSSPMLSKLANNAAERAVKKACDKARNTITQKANSALSSIRSIPGYGDFNSLTQGQGNAALSDLGTWAATGNGAPLKNLPSAGNLPSVNWGSIPGISKPPSGISSPAPSPTAPINPKSPVPPKGGIPGITVH